MDKMIYLAMSGAKAMEQRQHALTNNLANASTDGFRADLTAFRAVPVRAQGSATTRVFSMEATAGFDSKSGPIRTTDNPMDMAVKGDGWFAIQGPDGQEGYTRNGAFAIGPEGTLQTQTGHAVVGDGGPIVMPPNASLILGSDGTVSAKTDGQPAVQVGRLKLVKADQGELTKSESGLMHAANGANLQADETVQVIGGSLEGSNVNVVEAMVGMIAVSRQFDMQMRMLQNAESNDAKATSVLSRNG